MPQRIILFVAVIACALGLGDMECLTRRFADLEAAQTKSTSVGHEAVAGPDHSLPERFLVTYRGCALLGPDGEEKERLESITNGAGAISPDGRWVAFGRSRHDTTSNE